LQKRYASLAGRPAECEYVVDHRVATLSQPNVPVQTHFINGTAPIDAGTLDDQYGHTVDPHGRSSIQLRGYVQYRACNVDRTVALYDLCYRCDSCLGSGGTGTVHIGQQINAGSAQQARFQPAKVSAPDLVQLPHYHQVTLNADDGFSYHVSLNRPS
jgi:hypothetical protein